MVRLLIKNNDSHSSESHTLAGQRIIEYAHEQNCYVASLLAVSDEGLNQCNAGVIGTGEIDETKLRNIHKTVDCGERTMEWRGETSGAYHVFEEVWYSLQ